MLSCLSRFSRRSFHLSSVVCYRLSLKNTLQVKPNARMSKFVYPEVRRDHSFVENKFGVDVADPYRWLEDVDSSETAEFVAKQNALTIPYIDSCPHKTDIKKRLTELWDFPKYGTPSRRGSNYFFAMNTGLQPQHVLYIMRGSLTSPPEVFFDPNKLSEDGTVSLNQQAFSFDGKWFAYALSKSGSDWTSIKVRNVDTGEDLPEELMKIKFSSIAFTADNKGFFYSYYPDVPKDFEGKETADLLNQKLFYHRLGTDQKEDVFIHARPDDPKLRITASVTSDGAYLHISLTKTCDFNQWYVHKFDDPLAPKIDGPLQFEPIVTELTADYGIIANLGPIQYVYTNRNAPNYCLIAVDLSTAESRKEENWKTIIEEHPKNVLEDVCATRNDLLITVYMIDVANRIQLRSLTDGKVIKELALPVGTIVSAVHSKQTHEDVFYSIMSFLTPGTSYHLKLTEKDVEKCEPVVFKETEIKNIDPKDFVTKQIFYASKDGTKIPMFIVHHKDLVPSAETPCLLYGYGGFNISLKPWFSVYRFIMLNHLNGVFALPNIRGGGEYGKKWNEDGSKLNKQNCFDDFIGAAEYLCEQGITSAKKLIIQGGSNGGLLVAACALQRPDLFGCAIAQVGVLDMLRFHKFTIGHAWTSDYGNPDEEEHFRNLIKFSPYHNVPKNVDQLKYFPAILLLTADHDDRVVPLHSFKMIAELQAKLATQSDNPLMIRIDTKAGHGAGKPTEKIIDEMADIYGFIINSLGLNYK